MRGASLRVRRRLLLPLLCGIAAAVKSDLRIYLADPASDIGSAPTDDTCTYSTAFGTMNAQSGCGIPVAIDGVAVNETTNDTVFMYPTPLAEPWTFGGSPPSAAHTRRATSANGRNAIHIMTQTVELAAEGAMPPAKNKTVAIQISSNRTACAFCLVCDDGALGEHGVRHRGLDGRARTRERDAHGQREYANQHARCLMGAARRGWPAIR